MQLIMILLTSNRWQQKRLSTWKQALFRFHLPYAIFAIVIVVKWSERHKIDPCLSELSVITNQQELRERSWCVLKYHSTWSVTRVQRAFRRNFQHDAPCNKTLLKWYRQFVEQGCICDKRKAHSGKWPLNAEIAGDICMEYLKTCASS